MHLKLGLHSARAAEHNGDEHPSLRHAAPQTSTVLLRFLKDYQSALIPPSPAAAAGAVAAAAKGGKLKAAAGAAGKAPKGGKQGAQDAKAVAGSKGNRAAAQNPKARTSARAAHPIGRAAHQRCAGTHTHACAHACTRCRARCRARVATSLCVLYTAARACTVCTLTRLQADAWSALFSELDARLKAKRCCLDDIVKAVTLLPHTQRQASQAPAHRERAGRRASSWLL